MNWPAGPAHAPLAPSDGELWTNCPGSRRLRAALPPEEDSESTAEGTAAHWVALTMASEGRIPSGLAPNGVEITAEMIHGGNLWTRELASWGGTPHMETRLEPAASLIHPDCWGTPDAALYQPPVRLIRIADYKFGHRYVEEYENIQLVIYGVLFMAMLRLSDLDVWIEFVVVQPRFYGAAPVRRYRCKASDLRALVNMIQAAAYESEKPDSKLVVGPWCRDCRAAAGCPALQRAAHRQVEYALRLGALASTPAQVGCELHAVDEAIRVLTDRRAALEAIATAMLHQGHRVPFYREEFTAGREVWNVDHAQVIQMGKMLNLDIAKPMQAITPKQARELGFPPHLAGTLTKRNPGKRVLVPATLTEAEKVFKS